MSRFQNTASGAKRKMARLLLVRHGQTDWNVQRRYQGQTDIPLNENGYRQAALVAEELKEVALAAVYSSALERAYRTAALIAHSHGIQVISDPRLNEIDQGEWEGLRREEIAERYGERLRRWEEDPTSTHPPGGESLNAVRRRVIGCLQEIVLKHPEDTVCIVAHKVTNAIIMSEILGLSIGEMMRQEPAHTRWEEIRCQARYLDKAEGTI